MKVAKEIVIGVGIFLMLFAGLFVYGYTHRHSRVVELLLSELRIEETLQHQVQSTHSDSAIVAHVPILIYHSVRPPYPGETEIVKQYTASPENFEAQLKYIEDNGYTVLPLDTLVNYLHGETTIPAKSIVLTFDDGWANQIEYALPLLQKYHMTATFFVYTHVLGHHNYMNWQDLKILENAGMSIGDHTETHPYLFKITDEKVMSNEVMRSKKTLEEFLGKPVTNFAFPFGRYSDLAIKTIKDAGFYSARTTYVGTENSSENLFTLNGYLVKDDPHFVEEVLRYKK